jgi:hypothetical protein
MSMGLFHRAALGALLSVLGAVIPLHAQSLEVGAYGTVARTGVREFGNPAGLGLSLTWALGDVVGFRLEGSRMGSSPRWRATTCEELWPQYTGCREETVENDVRGTNFAALLVMAPFRRDGWRIEGVFGVSRTHFAHEIAGVETGRPLNYVSDEEAGSSPAFGAAVIREGVGSARLSARLEWRHARMSGTTSTCPADGRPCPPSWDGFAIVELRLGAAWRF